MLYGPEALPGHLRYHIASWKDCAYKFWIYVFGYISDSYTNSSVKTVRRKLKNVRMRIVNYQKNVTNFL